MLLFNKHSGYVTLHVTRVWLGHTGRLYRQVGDAVHSSAGPLLSQDTLGAGRGPATLGRAPGKTCCPPPDFQEETLWTKCSPKWWCAPPSSNQQHLRTHSPCPQAADRPGQRHMHIVSRSRTPLPSGDNDVSGGNKDPQERQQCPGPPLPTWKLTLFLALSVL